MKADYEYEEKLYLQFNSEEIDLLDSAVTKLKNNTSKIGFRKGVINKDELEVFTAIQGVIKEMRQEETKEE
jgi:hypothetical protein